MWSPKNSDGGFRGAMQLQQAFWASRNVVAVSVAHDVGITKIIDIAHRMGIKYPLDPYLPTAIGASVVVPMEICSGYSTLANGGVNNPPTGIMRITNHDGDVLYEHSPEPTRAIPTDVANTMKMMMRGVIEKGTAHASMGVLPFPASGQDRNH